MSTENIRRLDPALVTLVKSLNVGERIKITQTLKVGAKTWPAETVGTYRGISYLSTGITTDRVVADDIVVPLVQFTKDNGELASISLDERTKIERVA